MALLVRDMLSLPVAQTFRLVAGEGGLNNQVRYVNLIDFEYDMAELGTKGSKGMFNARSFIVTSLQFAKHDFNRILPAFQQLKRDGVSAIAVKEVYFQTLPAKVVQFANENNIAVFLFASEKNYLEDVVVGMAIALDESENFLALSEKVGQLLTLEENSTQLFRVVHDLFGKIPDCYFCMYMIPIRIMSSYEYQFFIRPCGDGQKKTRLCCPMNMVRCWCSPSRPLRPASAVSSAFLLKNTPSVSAARAPRLRSLSTASGNAFLRDTTVLSVECGR